MSEPYIPLCPLWRSFSYKCCDFHHMNDFGIGYMVYRAENQRPILP
jgi:hypothetical protein